MKGTMNPCVTWTLHAGSYCVLSQWRPRPRWWKVYSPDEAMQPWLTPPPPQPLLPWAWEQAGTFVHPFHHAVGRGQTRAISCLFQLAPIAYHVTFGWLAHMCVASYWLVLPRETLQDNISHKYQNFCAFSRCLSFAQCAHPSSLFVCAAQPPLILGSQLTMWKWCLSQSVLFQLSTNWRVPWYYLFWRLVWV